MGFAQVTTLGDTEDGHLGREHSPERAPLAGGTPAGLVDVEGPGVTNVAQQLVVGFGERLSGTTDDPVNATGRESDAEQLAQKLNRVAP
ncbi:MAG: hypothetical protein M5U22_08050 [Thermoleophilia bacterium]|nr:hypothetical protein [Thermoleophilia bacterium]